LAVGIPLVLSPAPAVTPDQSKEVSKTIIITSRESPMKKQLNGIFYIGALISIGLIAAYLYYIRTDAYIAQQQYTQGIELIQSGEISNGVNILKPLIANEKYSQKVMATYSDLLKTEKLSILNDTDTTNLLKSLSDIPSLKNSVLENAKPLFSKLEKTQAFLAAKVATTIANTSNKEKEIEQYRLQAHHLYQQDLKPFNDDYILALEFALLNEAYGQCAQCETVLKPHQQELLKNEGARVLGQYYARSNQIDEAYALLHPYTQDKLALYQEAERAYEEELDNIWTTSIAELNQNKAPEAFYTRYDAANKEQQQVMVDEYYNNNVKNSISAQNKRNNYQEQANIVPVALDLGIVMLNRAANISDETERQRELSATEEIFLSVKGYAGNTDEYQLYLGQVYFWLGQEEKGNVLFNKLAEKYQRNHNVLYSLSSTLRNLGDHALALSYATEAYEKAPLGQEKQAIAYQLNLISRDIDEKISWLEKSDTTQAYVQADLYSKQAIKAEQDNKFKTAESLILKSLQAYEGLEETSTNLNNSALVHMQLFYLNGNESSYKAALDNMDKAVALTPDDPIVLYNSSNYHIAKVYRDILLEYFNKDFLSSVSSLSLFRYIYKNEGEKQKFRELMLQHKSFKKWHSYIQRAITLSPKDSQFITGAYKIYEFVDLNDELKKLSLKAANGKYDKSNNEKFIAEYRNKRNDEDLAKNIKNSLSKVSEDLKRFTKDKYPKEHSYLRNREIQIELQWASIKSSLLNTEGLAKKAKNLTDNYKSSATHSAYLSSLLSDIVNDSKKANIAFKKLHEEYYRILSNENIIAITAMTSPEYKQYISSSSKMRLLIDEKIITRKNFPTSSMQFWLLLHALDHDYKTQEQQNILENQTFSYGMILEEKTNANKEDLTMNRYIQMLINNKDNDAKTLLKEAINEGVDLPEEMLAI